VDAEIRVFLTSALVGGKLLASRPGGFTLAETASSSHWIGGWVRLRTGLHYMIGGNDVLRLIKHHSVRTGR
jgi:hypothetical protein